MLEPRLLDKFEQLEMRCSLESILDENYGLIRSNSMYEVMEDHFDRPEDPNNT